MEQTELLALLRQVRSGETSPDAAARLLAPYEDLGYARVDLHRRARQGAAEVIFGEGKTPEQIAGVVRSQAEQRAPNILINRHTGEKEAQLPGQFSNE